MPKYSGNVLVLRSVLMYLNQYLLSCPRLRQTQRSCLHLRSSNPTIRSSSSLHKHYLLLPILPLSLQLLPSPLQTNLTPLPSLLQLPNYLHLLNQLYFPNHLQVSSQLLFPNLPLLRSSGPLSSSPLLTSHSSGASYHPRHHLHSNRAQPLRPPTTGHQHLAT